MTDASLRISPPAESGAPHAIDTPTPRRTITSSHPARPTPRCAAAVPRGVPHEPPDVRLPHPSRAAQRPDPPRPRARRPRFRPHPTAHLAPLAVVAGPGPVGGVGDAARAARRRVGHGDQPLPHGLVAGGRRGGGPGGVVGRLDHRHLVRGRHGVGGNRTFAGSRAGRAIFTALLAGSTVIGLWSAVAPQAAALGSGELILAAAPPTFMSLTSLAVALVAIAVLALLYRPDVNDYFRAHSPATTGQRDRDLLEPARPQTRTDAPLTMSSRTQHRATDPTERIDTTATPSPALPTTAPSREEPIAPAL